MSCLCLVYQYIYYLGNLAKTKEGKKAEELHLESFEKFQKAIEIKADDHKAYYNWGTYLGKLAKIKEGKEAEQLSQLSFEKLQKAVELGGNCYNLACWYAVKENKKDALLYLDLSLNKKEVETSFVLKDEDWKKYLDDKDFIEIINKYK